ncbi:MAG: ERCC4 domain-containing protein [Promethearchaeota archaeon]
MSKKLIPHVIIDVREKKLIEIFKRKKESITHEVKQLDVADVVITNEVACERKEGFDFIASIMDNRLFEQLLRLKETYTTPILLLEGLNQEVFETMGMSLSSIYGALSFISYKLGIPLIPTRHVQDTALVIERIAYREQVKDNAPILSRKAPKGMNDNERRAYILEGLIDTGPKKAQLLIKKFKTPYNVMRAIKNTRIIYTKTGKPKGIEGPLKEIPGFGWKYLQKNKKILFGMENNAQKKIDDHW